ncbi:MAG: putative rane protein [Microbacterium sp.]|nr:putative rane protein [Microbacterium sp.]
MSDTVTPRRPVVVAIWLVFAGIVGWWAAFSLTMERFAQLKNPGEAASCDFSVLVQCSANLQSPQGSVFGFPNPIIGLTAWMAPVVVGMALLAGAQSIFVLATLCPWCMVTWSVVIPSFFVVTLHVLREGVIPAPRVRHVAERLMPWVPLMTLAAFVVIAVIAQARLNVLAQF